MSNRATRSVSATREERSVMDAPQVDEEGCKAARCATEDRGRTIRGHQDMVQGRANCCQGMTGARAAHHNLADCCRPDFPSDLQPPLRTGRRPRTTECRG